MTTEQAVDVMLGHVKDATPSGLTIVWEDVPANKPTSQRWVRPTVRHALGAQSTLTGAFGTKRHTMGGMLIVQCFTPVGGGATEAIRLASTYLNYFCAVRNSSVWYRNQSIAEIGKDGASLQYNVAIEFEYDITIARP